MNIRVRGSSNGLTNHRGGDVYRGLLMHTGLLLLLLAVVVVVDVAGLTSGRALGSTVTLLRPNVNSSMDLDDQAMR